MMLCVRLADTVELGLNLRSFLVALVTGNVNSLSDSSVFSAAAPRPASIHVRAAKSAPRFTTCSSAFESQGSFVRNWFCSPFKRSEATSGMSNGIN